MTAASPSFHCQAPATLVAACLDRFAAFVAAHGGVPPERVRDNLERAFRIVWAEQGNAIAGISCLKRPRPEYLENLCHRVQLPLEGFLERGYTCVHPEHAGQGIAGRLVALLREAAGDRPYYALVHERNPAIQAILRQGGEVKLQSFYSDLAGRELGLWVSPAGLARLQDVRRET